MRLLLLLNPSPWKIIKGDHERGTQHPWQHWDHFRLIFRRRVMRMRNAANTVRQKATPHEVGVVLRISTQQRGWWSNSTARSSRDAYGHLHSQGRGWGRSAQSRGNWSPLSDHMDEHPFLVWFLKPPLKKKKERKKIVSKINHPELQHLSRCFDKVRNPHPQSASSFPHCRTHQTLAEMLHLLGVLWRRRNQQQRWFYGG